MLYTASFYEPRHWVGTRFRISRAHPRGRRTDWEVQPALYPSRALLTEYRRGDLDFPGLDARYREELDITYDSSEGFRCFLQALPDVGDFTPPVLRTGGYPLPPAFRSSVADQESAWRGTRPDALIPVTIRCPPDAPSVLWQPPAATIPGAAPDR